MAMMTVNGLGVGGILRQFQVPLLPVRSVDHRTRVSFMYDMCDFLALKYRAESKSRDRTNHWSQQSFDTPPISGNCFLAP